MLQGAVCFRLSAEKLPFLQAGMGGHAFRFVSAGKVENRKIQRMKAGKGDELELLPHRSKFPLEARNGRFRKMLPPVERRRAVVGQHFTGELCVHSFCKFLRFLQVWLGRFAPE